MPSLSKRPCSQPGCGVLVSSGRCPAHQRTDDGHPVKTTAERGYDAAHKRLRVLCFVRDEWRCVDCGWEPELVKTFRLAGMPAPSTDAVLRELRIAYSRHERHLHADHEVPIEQAEELRLDLDNLRTRCNECHSVKTAREDGGFGHRSSPQKSANRESFSRESATKRPFVSVV